MTMAVCLARVIVLLVSDVNSTGIDFNLAASSLACATPSGTSPLPVNSSRSSD